MLAVPRIHFTLEHTLVQGVADGGISGILPFRLCWQAILRQQDTVFHLHVAVLAAGDVTETFLSLSLVGFVGQVSVGVEIAFCGRGLGELDIAAIHQNLLIDTVGTPSSVVGGLQPVDTHHGIVTESRVAEIVFHLRFIVSQAVAPHSLVGDGVVIDHFQVLRDENALQPIEVLEVVDVGDLALIHVERGDRDAARGVVPVLHHVLFHLAHHEGTAFDEDEAGTGGLLLEGSHLETAVLGIVVIPARGGGFLFLTRGHS